MDWVRLSANLAMHPIKDLPCAVPVAGIEEKKSTSIAMTPAGQWACGNNVELPNIQDETSFLGSNAIPKHDAAQRDVARLAQNGSWSSQCWLKGIAIPRCEGIPNVHTGWCALSLLLQSTVLHMGMQMLSTIARVVQPVFVCSLIFGSMQPR